MFQRITNALVVLLCVNAIIWLYTALRFLGYPYSIDFGEGILLCQSAMLIHGQNIYPPITDYPYIVSNYHPLYPFIAGIPFLITNPGIWSGRLLTLISCLGSFSIIGLVVFKSTKNRNLGLISALLPLCLSYPYNWAFVYRVDYLGIFLSLLGLYFHMYPPKKYGIYFSIIPFALAFMTKLTFVLAPVACILDLIIRKDKRSLPFTLGIILSFGIPYLAINLATDFGMFRDTLIYTANAFHIDRMIDGFREILSVTLWLWLLVGIGAVTTSGKHKPLLLSYLFLLLISLATYGAEGSDSNYFIEIILALCMISFAWFPSDDWKGSFINLKSIAFILIVVFCFSGRIMNANEFGEARNLKTSTTNGKQIEAFVANAQGDVISEEMSFLARNGKQMVFQPYIMSLLYRKGKWDQTRFVDDLRDGKFNLIILRFDVNDLNHTDKPGMYGEAGFDRFTNEMEEAIKTSYQVFNPIRVGNDNWYVYMPKS